MVADNIFLLFILGFMALVTYLDLRFREIPSIFLSIMLLILLIVYPENLYFGILSLVLAVVFFEMDYFKGVADIKVMTILGLTISSMGMFSLYIFFISLLGFGWMLLMAFMYHSKEKEIPFIPVFFVTYIFMIILKSYNLEIFNF